MESLAVGPENGVMTPDFWRNKRVLITGHSGFKGGWLAIWLQSLGAQITGISLKPNSSPNLFSLAGIESFCENHFCDIRDAKELASIIHASRPQIIFHMAAQPLVRASYACPADTFSTNVMGTTNVLDAVRGQEEVKVVIAITTDKVYKNNEWLWPYRESDALGGHDPYSASKAACELVIDCYRKSYLDTLGIACASARSGNVVGGGDWSRDRLIPDAVMSWQSEQAMIVRHPNAVRPWQHVLEPLYGYLRLAESLWHDPKLADPYNFGPATEDTFTVEQVLSLARLAYGSGDIKVVHDRKGPHEAGLLALDTSKSRHVLGIKQKWPLAEAIKRTMDWYKALGNGGNALNLCQADIATYQSLP